MLTAEPLPALQQVALAQTPAFARPFLSDLLSFDTRLSRLVGKAKEPMLGQMRLAWWREQLALPAAQRAKGDPMLAALGARWGGEEQALTGLVDAWEQLLEPAPLGSTAIAAFASGRGLAFGALARVAGEARSVTAAAAAGTRWALADLAMQVTSSAEQDDAAALLAAEPQEWQRLPRALRGVSVLELVARRALAEGRMPMTARSDAFFAMRVGLLGR